MRCYRITKEKYAKDLSGEGAKRSGGRWNSKGTPLIYTSSTTTLALLEVLVHLDLVFMPKSFVAVEYDIPDDIPAMELHADLLPDNWNDYPAPQQTALIGDEFVQESNSLLLKVPTAVTETFGEYNVLINPIHPLITKVSVSSIIKIDPDQRLIKKPV